MLLAVIIFGLAIGAVLGLLGGGGSILTVPALAYGLGLEAKAAIATSLLVVGATSLIALVPHARAGHVKWKVGLGFGGVSMIGAFAGGWAARFVPGVVLLVLFAVVMVAAGVAMLRPQRVGPTEANPRPALFAVEALAVGAFTGLVGAGGGFVVVPALVLLGGLSMRAAVGTSLLVIAMKSAAGLAGQLSHAQIDATIAGIFVVAAAAGALAGARLSQRVRPDRLRRGFGIFVLVTAALILVRELGAL